MPIDVEVVRSPGWWLKVLGRELHARNRSPQWSRVAKQRGELRPPLELLWDYFRGDPPLPQAADGWKAGFREFLRMSRMNYAELVVEAARERMVFSGFRTGAAGDENEDGQARKIMRANDFYVFAADVIQWMLALADGYAIVGKPRANGIPLLTAEDPRQTITAHDAATGEYLAGLKLFRDDWDGTDFAHVFVPGQVHVATRKSGTSALAGPTFRLNPRSWEWDEKASGDIPGGDGVIPIVRFRNRNGVGEYEPHLDVLDRINNTILDRVVISKIQSFRQRAIRNLPDIDEKTGEVIDYTGMFDADPGALWKVPEGVEFWESQPVDQGPIRESIKDDVQGLASVTRTPLHYVTPQAAEGSAEGATLMREGHIYRVEDRRNRAAGSMARVMALAFRFMEDSERSDPAMIEALWKPAERFSLGERFDAVSKAKGILPTEALWTDVLQYAPDEVPRLQAQRATDILFVPPDVETEVPAGA